MPITQADHLYTLAYGERAYSSPEGCYEAQIAWDEYGEEGAPWVIEKYTALDAAHFLPRAVDVAEYVADAASDEMSADACEEWTAAMTAPDVLEAFAAAMKLMASKVTWQMCGTKVGEHRVTFTEDGEPLLDGEPMYAKSEEG